MRQCQAMACDSTDSATRRCLETESLRKSGSRYLCPRHYRLEALESPAQEFVIHLN